MKKDIISLSMYRSWINAEEFDSSVKNTYDNRGLEVEEDFLEV